MINHRPTKHGLSKVSGLLHKFLVSIYLWLATTMVWGMNSFLDEPIATANRHPLIQGFGLPTARSARIPQSEVKTVGLQIEIGSFASIFERETSLFVMDGEFYRSQLTYTSSPAPDIELSFELPYVYHGGGGLDNFIVEWHDFFHLPNGHRDVLPTHDLRYEIIENNELLYSRQLNGGDLGGLRLHLAYQWENDRQTQLATRLTMKLPSGNSETLSDSESFDLALAVHLTQELRRKPSYYWVFHGSFGGMFLSEGKIIPSRQRSHVFFASTTLAWVYEPISLKAQLDYHSAFYDSLFDELGKYSVQLTFGGSIELSEQLAVDITVAEDIYVAHSPDVVFQLGLRYQFN